MPNDEFCSEIQQAAKDLYNLHADADVQKSHL